MAVNLLPWREHQTQKARKRFFYVVICTAILTIIICYSLQIFFNIKIKELQTANQLLQHSGSSQNTSPRTHNNTQRLQQLTAILQLMQTQQYSQFHTATLIKNILRSRSAHLSFNKWMLTKKRFFLTGETASLAAINSVLLALKQQPRLANIRLTDIGKSDTMNPKDDDTTPLQPFTIKGERHAQS